MLTNEDPKTAEMVPGAFRGAAARRIADERRLRLAPGSNMAGVMAEFTHQALTIYAQLLFRDTVSPMIGDPMRDDVLAGVEPDERQALRRVAQGGNCVLPGPLAQRLAAKGWVELAGNTVLITIAGRTLLEMDSSRRDRPAAARADAPN